MTIGFKLNADGDISLDTNKHWTLLSTYQELVRQRLEITFRTFQTEWFLDTSFGMPYLASFDGTATILGKGLSKDDIDALFVSKIRKDPDVLKLEAFSSTYNQYTRNYDVRMEVKTIDGLLRVDVPSIKPWDEVVYPTPEQTVLRPTCDFDLIAIDNELHPYVHYYAPMGPTFGWIGALDYGLDNQLIFPTLEG